MRTTHNLIILILLFIFARGVADAQKQDELSWLVKSSLRSFIRYANPSFSSGVSLMATAYLSEAAGEAKTEEDFKALMVAARILYCQKVLEDLTQKTPNYSKIKDDFESEVKNDLTALKNSTQ